MIALESSEILLAAAGGALIGLAAALLLGLNGRIAGVSSILGGLLAPGGEGRPWRGAFAAGLLAGGLLLALLAPEALPRQQEFPGLPVLLLAGLLVGYGAALARGCTSGHGICGLARLSRRSLAATATFMASALATVAVVRHLLGGDGS